MARGYAVVALIGLLVAVSVWRRDSRWLRYIAVLASAGWGMMLLFGLAHIARFGAADDRSGLETQAKYGEAFRDGLLAAQEVAWRYLGPLMLIGLLLVVLALTPRGPKRRLHEDGRCEPKNKI